MYKKTTACFTGHRPEKMTDKVLAESVISKIKSMLYLTVLEAVRDNGYRTFISGMAKGVDMWACNIVLDLKHTYPDVKLVCAMPYRTHGQSWTGVDKYELNRYLQSADKVIFVSEEYDRDCYKRRNHFMVDNSSLLIGICKEERSGTGQTIRYAKRQGIDTRIIKI